MAARQPDPDPIPPPPLLIVVDSGFDAGLLASLGGTPIRFNRPGRWRTPLDLGPLADASAPAAGA